MKGVLLGAKNRSLFLFKVGSKSCLDLFGNHYQSQSLADSTNVLMACNCLIHLLIETVPGYVINQRKTEMTLFPASK